jgi:hypothetical protein
MFWIKEPEAALTKANVGNRMQLRIAGSRQIAMKQLCPTGDGSLAISG